jgi:hypothetical protein
MGKDQEARALGPSWGRETAVNNGQPRCPADSQTYSSSAVIGRDGAAGPYMACKGSGRRGFLLVQLVATAQGCGPG